MGEGGGGAVRVQSSAPARACSIRACSEKQSGTVSAIMLHIFVYELVSSFLWLFDRCIFDRDPYRCQRIPMLPRFVSMFLLFLYAFPGAPFHNILF